MRNNRHLAFSVSFGLSHPIVEVASFDTLYLEVNTGQSIAHHVGAVNAALELNTTPRLVSVLAERLREFKFAVLAFAPRVHRTIPKIKRQRMIHTTMSGVICDTSLRSSNPRRVGFEVRATTAFLRPSSV